MEDSNLISPAGVPSEQRSLGMWMHLTPLLATVASFVVPIPFLSLIATYVIYSTQKDKGDFVAENGRESVNFQITLAIVFVALIIILIVMFGGSILSTIFGSQSDNDTATGAGIMGMIGSSLLMITAFAIIGIGALVFMVVGTFRANNGNVYRYPVSLRLVK
ncbi:DUF4870 domain-containing protein [Persicitalea jodogahamensis]|uniref:DUF4870 domain-containing protein n=1 Tax=Persicitalea jodogahamensis TaxID=402147 RepID=A0A8J3D6F7_9BACT|nr:DUF4870 domain-containing protein [Persicitalea jodogahamensis]GHB81216.1 hypothetical protein GCM10007390_39950 [Persicitalea jodogahamensis]